MRRNTIKQIRKAIQEMRKGRFGICVSNFPIEIEAERKLREAIRTSEDFYDTIKPFRN